MSITRRRFLGTSAQALAAIPLSGPLWAQSDVMIGDMTLTTLSDGHLRLPAQMIIGDAHKDEAQPILDAYGIGNEVFEPECNVTLLRHQDRVILFDTGAGANFMPSAGKLLDALYDAGVDPYDVTDVVFTHAHPDHIWGLLDDFDDLSFPEANYFIGEAEWAYWTDPDTVDTIGEERAAFAVGAASRLGLIEDRINMVRPGQDILPGVQAVASFGHTPGHLAYAVTDGSASAMILGDCIGNHHLAFEKPGWASGSDQDPEIGAATRVALLDQLASDQTKVLGFHLPGGGIGQVERHGEAYRFVPEA